MGKQRECIICKDTYILHPNKPGLSSHCPACSEETTVKYTGNMIYSDKTCPQLQINTDPKLTEYIRNATKLQNKGSNLGNNLKVSSNMVRSNGCAYALSDVARRRNVS